MDRLDPLEAFVDRVTSAQQGLFAYILSLVAHVDDAKDVLQETNLILWRKREEYRMDAPFWPWAKTIAHYQILAFIKRRGRDRLRFGDLLLARLAEDAAAFDGQSVDVEQTALDQCIEELAPPKRELIELRYSDDIGLAEISRKTGRSPGAIADALYRIRGQLADCIRNKLTGREEDR
ncbi:MAG: sigma-70 family RNA polymerase sigma factor [Pirellulales bacterium]|nr:sigma-70 family RNA polymerase sigma factor [Pirellulales bacterium]